MATKTRRKTFDTPPSEKSFFQSPANLAENVWPTTSKKTNRAEKDIFRRPHNHNFLIFSAWLVENRCFGWKRYREASATV